MRSTAAAILIIAAAVAVGAFAFGYDRGRDAAFDEIERFKPEVSCAR